MHLEVIVLYTISGCTGVGKTSLIRKALAEIPDTHILPSYTTRKPRENDLPGEYTHLSDNEWRSALMQSVFAWHVHVRDMMYGTRREDVRAALDSTRLFLACIAPETVSDVYSLALSFGLRQQVRSIYILSPDRRVLFERLTKGRGMTPDKANADLDGCAGWDDKARHQGRFSYHYIRDRDSLDKKFAELRSALIPPR
jgi:guanylate kinase